MSCNECKHNLIPIMEHTCINCVGTNRSLFEPKGEPVQAEDMVNSPSHYKAGGIETIEYMQAKMTPEQFKGYLTGNILKYISRYQYKNGIEDVKKAQWYLNKLVEHMEERGDS